MDLLSALLAGQAPGIRFGITRFLSTTCSRFDCEFSIGSLYRKLQSTASTSSAAEICLELSSGNVLVST